jgi:hypothetical protein
VVSVYCKFGEGDNWDMQAVAGADCYMQGSSSMKPRQGGSFVLVAAGMLGLDNHHTPVECLQLEAGCSFCIGPADAEEVLLWVALTL